MDEDSIFIEKHKGLVFSFAYKNYKDWMIYEEEEKKMELIHEGFLGLLRARDKFDETLGFQFSTYATRWIWGMMHRYFENENKAIEKYNKLNVCNDVIVLERSHEERELIDIVSVKSDEGVIDLMNYLLSLNETEKELCELLIDGYSIKEISAKLNIGYSNTSRIVNNLRNKIKKEYLKYS